MYDNVTISKQGKSIIINVKGNEFTLIDDGTMEEGQVACLDVADGNIDLYSNGYKQYTGNLQGLNKNGATEYTGKYIITGTTTENVVRVCDEGTYNLTIKNLKINVSNTSSTTSPFNANAGEKGSGCFVNITLEGNNTIYSNGIAGIQFGAESAQINRSTLIINGEGYLDVQCKNGHCAGIGGGNSKPVCDIVIESGNITAIGHGHASGIGGKLRQKVGNITINGGNIYAEGGTIAGSGIGEGWQGEADNIIINGGNLRVKGGEYGAGIGSKDIGIANNIIINSGIIYVESGGIGSIGSGNLQINGGDINCSRIGLKCSQVLITGGKIKTTNNSLSAITCAEGGRIEITGGNIFAKGKNNLNIGTYSGSTLVPYTPTDGANNLYETQIKLQDVGENKKITNLTTSDNIEYGINDMYTLENGMLYLYLPTGTRTITITTEDGKTYSGTVETKETPEEVVLNEIN